MNLDVVNNSNTTPQRLVFNMTRTIPFLSNAEDYFLTVARFNLQTSNSLPVFIPDILTGQNNVDLTVYNITLSATNNGVSSTQTLPVQYRVSDTTQPTPSSPLQSVDKSSSYYWVYNVNDWVAMLNSTLANTTLLINNVIGEGLTVINPPYIQYDLTTGFFTLYVDQDAVADKSFKIYFNPSLYNVLPFPSIYMALPASSPLVYLYRVNTPNTLANQSSTLVGNDKKDYLFTTTE
jgi:hypothetical protein